MNMLLQVWEIHMKMQLYKMVYSLGEDQTDYV